MLHAQYFFKSRVLFHLLVHGFHSCRTANPIRNRQNNEYSGKNVQKCSPAGKKIAASDFENDKGKENRQAFQQNLPRVVKA